MGCGASKDTGRENYNDLSAGFFPPDEQKQGASKPDNSSTPGKTNTNNSSTPNNNSRNTSNNNNSTTAAVATTTSSISNPSPTKITEAKTTSAPTPQSAPNHQHQHSHKEAQPDTPRRKSNYVPPAPIIITTPSPPPSAPATGGDSVPQSPKTTVSSSNSSLQQDLLQSSTQHSAGSDSLELASFQPDSSNVNSLGGVPLSPTSSTGSGGHHHQHNSSSIAYQAAGQPRRSSASDENLSGSNNNNNAVPPIPGVILGTPEKNKKKKKASSSAATTASSSSSSTGDKKSKSMPPQRHHHEGYPEDTPEPSSASGMRFDELYRLKGVLGTGAFSTVREGYHRSNTSLSYAVKCVNRKKLSEEDEAALLDEVSILKAMKHQHIIRLYDFFIEPSTYYLVMERMRGGELFDRIVAKAYYNEKEARDTCKILLEAVGYCHENSVAHRDLKPENLLLLSESDDSAVKIADFGFAKKVIQPNSLTTQCGTPGYVAPEILEGIPYDQRADMWSVGVILYILLGGYPPFIENNQRDLFRKIRRGEYEFHEEYWGTVSHEAKDLISSLLQVDPAARLSAGQALDNPWIRGDDDLLAGKDLGVNLKEFRKFNAKRKFKAAVSTIMAVNKLQSLGKDFLSNLKHAGISNNNNTTTS